MNRTFGVNRVEAEKRFSWHFCAARLNSYRFSRNIVRNTISSLRDREPQRLEIQVLRACQLKICERASWFRTLLRRSYVSRPTLNAKIRGRAIPRSRNPISTIIVSGCTAYQKRSGVHDARLSFKIFHHLSLSVAPSEYACSSSYSGILSAMLVHVGLRRALCPLLVIRFTMLLFLRPLSSHTSFTCYVYDNVI